MKKLFLALVAATGMFAAASAQRTEIAVSYGGSPRWTPPTAMTTGIT